jgi:Family of unknown function (DUF6152)
MRTFPAFAAIATLTLASPAWAHHPFESEFDANAPVRLSGTITKVDWADPHVVVQIGVVDAGGQTHNWNCEGASPSIRPISPYLAMLSQELGR